MEKFLTLGAELDVSALDTTTADYGRLLLLLRTELIRGLTRFLGFGEKAADIEDGAAGTRL